MLRRTMCWVVALGACDDAPRMTDASVAMPDTGEAGDAAGSDAPPASLTGWPTPFAERANFLSDELVCYPIPLARRGTLTSFHVFAPADTVTEPNMYTMALYASGERPGALITAMAAPVALHTGVNDTAVGDGVVLAAGEPWLCMRLANLTQMSFELSGKQLWRCDSQGSIGFDVPWPTTFLSACGFFFPVNIWITTRPE